MMDASRYGAPSDATLWLRRVAWMCAAVAVCLYCLWRFSGSTPLQTNLLALLPTTTTHAVVEKATDTLSNTLGGRAVFLVTSADAAHAKAAAKQFGHQLARSTAFRTVMVDVPPFDLSQIAATYLPGRFSLLTDQDRARLESARLTLSEQLAMRLYSPPLDGLTTTVSDDPFGWLQHWLASLPLSVSQMTLEDSMLVSHRDGKTGVLVIAALNGSAYESKTQQATLHAIAEAERGLATRYPDIHIARAGTIFYADAARASAEREVHLIGVVSLCGIALLLLGVFRSPRLLILAFASTAFGIVCALAATLLLFGKLHLLTLVFGASLIGEAVDYSIQYFIVYLSADRKWDARHGMRAVRPALVVALTTSLLGYAIMLWVPFPGLKQIACFSIVGILAAFASVIGFLPLMMTMPVKRVPTRLFAVAARALDCWLWCVRGPRTAIVVVLCLLAAAPGWLLLKNNDDIHLLVQRDPTLASQEREVRDAVGLENTAQFFVVEGATPEAVLERSEALTSALAALDARQAVGSVQSISSFVPSAQRQARNRAVLAEHVFADREALRATLAQAGFRSDIADAWINAYARDKNVTLSIDTWLAARWSAPFRHLWLGRVDTDKPVYATIAIPNRVSATNIEALQRIARTMPGVTFVDQAANVSSLLGEYRADSSLWLASALIVIAAVLAWRYGVKAGLATTLPVLLSIGLTLAGFGYLGISLTLFHWLALMLVLGVGANYAVFLREGYMRATGDLGAVWVGVLLSASTTLLSFGMLSVSSMPALRGFGVTLAAGILLAVWFAPLSVASRKGDGR